MRRRYASRSEYVAGDCFVFGDGDEALEDKKGNGEPGRRRVDLPLLLLWVEKILFSKAKDCSFDIFDFNDSTPKSVVDALAEVRPSLAPRWKKLWLDRVAAPSSYDGSDSVQSLSVELGDPAMRPRDTRESGVGDEGGEGSGDEGGGEGALVEKRRRG